MKLIICPKCEDWVKLYVLEMRSCKCGHIKGQYLNNESAEVSEDAISVGVGNGSFVQAYGRLLDSINTEAELTRNEYIKECALTAWLRPNKGKGNPHTKII